jgi:hypothetical protein
VSDVRAKYVPPSVKQTAFNCPHCGALAKQYWFSMRAEPLSRKDATPTRVNAEAVAKETFADIEDPEQRERVKAWALEMATGRPFFRFERIQADVQVGNADISRCYHCNDIAIWIVDQMVWPRQGVAPLANPDMPDDIRRDYDEASTILDLSPRGAAALLRLAVQKLCKHLGEKGKNINEDIASLVAKGLDPRVQQALDVVRVVGNDAVHPGAMDLRDDRATAEHLFGLVNVIVERMISHPKHMDALYASLPASKLEEIERRNAKATATK